MTEVTSTGNSTDIEGIKVSADNVSVITSEGEVSVDKMTFSENDANLVAVAQEIATTEGDEVTSLFVNQYDGQADITNYRNSFDLVSSYAKGNFTEDYILQHKGVLSTDQVKAIYSKMVTEPRLAQQKAVDSLVAEMKSELGGYASVIDDSIIDYDSKTTDGTKVNWSDLSTRQRQAISFIKQFSEAIGVNLVYEQSKVVNGTRKGKNGSYDPGTNTITLDIFAGMKEMGDIVNESLISTFSHELTHWMKEKSPELYHKLDNLIFGVLANGKITESERIENEKKRIKKNHPEIENVTDEMARDEIIARACEDMLTMSEEGRRIFESMSEEEQKNFIEKVKEFIKNILEWVDKLLNQYKSESAEAEFLRDYKEELEAISKTWDEMLVKSIDSNKALEMSKSQSTESDVNKSENVQEQAREEYVAEIDAWVKEGKPDDEMFVLGSTGDVLQGLGAIESDIYMLGDKIKGILSKHPKMTIDEIKRIPQILENPVLILKSQNVGRNNAPNTRLVIFGSIKAQDGKPILSVLDLRPIESNLVVDDMQKVSSAYTKDTDPVDFIKNSLVVYANKKITPKLLRTIGFQTPIELQQSGYIGSISYKGQNVNINGQEFSKVFKENISKVQNSDRDSEGRELSEEQMEYFKESKVRDTNGKVYGGLKQQQHTSDKLSRESQEIIDEYREMLKDKYGKDVLVQNSERDYNEYDKPITVKDVEILRSIGKKSINKFAAEDIEKAQKWAYKLYKELGVKSPFFRAWFGEWRTYDKTSVKIANIPQYKPTNDFRKSNRGIVLNEDTRWNIRISREGETNTISHSGEGRLSEYGLSGIRELVQNAILFNSEVHEHHSNNAKEDAIAFDHKLYSIGEDIYGNIALYRITVEDYFQSKSEPSNKRFHNLKYIKKVAEITGGRTFGKNRSGGSTNGNSTTNYSVSDLYYFVKKYDNEFTASFTVDEHLLKNGKPKVFYHGTDKLFTEFKYDEISFREGSFFFAENRRDAEAYGKKVYEVYLTGKKLADYDNQPIEFFRLKDKKAQVEYLKAKGYDGWYADMDSDGWGEVSVFTPRQIKSAIAPVSSKANIGTFSKYESKMQYQDRNTESVYDLMGENEKLRKTNEILKADIVSDVNTRNEHKNIPGINFTVNEISNRQASNAPITANMNETKRFNILKDKKISLKQLNLTKLLTLILTILKKTPKR